MSGPGLGGLGLRTASNVPLSSRIEMPASPLGKSQGWLGGIHQAVEQWGTGLARQVLDRATRSSHATRAPSTPFGTSARSAGAARADAGHTAGVNGAGPAGSTAVRTAGTGRPMAALAAATRHARRAQETQALALVRLLGGAAGASGPPALPAPPAVPAPTLAPALAPMATLSRAMYLACLGALTCAPAPESRRTAGTGSAGGALVRGRADASAGPARPSRPAWGQPAALVTRPGPDRRPVASTDSAVGHLPVSTPDRVEEPDDERPRPPTNTRGRGGSVTDAPEPIRPANAGVPAGPAPTARISHLAAGPGNGDGAAAAAHASPIAASPDPADSPSGLSDADPAPAPAVDDERNTLMAQARELELQALRDGLQQMRDKLFQTQLQRVAKNIDALCSIM